MSLLDFVERPCPYCGETLQISLDPSVEQQTYIEDCQVCCSPFEVHVFFDGEYSTVELRHQDDA